ncbi:MAG: phospholipase [Methanoculleus sp. SDB]|nr:MAG: phospholipase [Methanoculleus sp. SDB]
MMRLLPVLLLLCVLCPAAGAVMITEFCPDTWQTGEQDEFLVLEGAGSLAGILVSDGEGSIRFPAGSRISGQLTIARYATAYRRTHGILPDYEIYDTVAGVPDVIRTGDMRLANSQDELVLSENGVVVQTVAWPADVRPREGQVHVCEEGIWDCRPFFIGQSRLSPATYHDVSLTAFVSPDCARTVLEQAIEDADRYIYANVYEMTDPFIAGRLASCASSGITVAVLLEGGPVGGIPDGESAAAAELIRSGATVLQMGTTDTAHARYRYTHAKYLLTDGDSVLLTSENFKPGGFPGDGISGNRGWGVYIEDPGVARYFETVWHEDAEGNDITPFVPRDMAPGDTGGGAYTAGHSPASFSGTVVTPVISPDTSRLIPGLIDSATRTLDIEQAYITPWPESGENPYLAAAIDAARRGVRVRVLLDSSWFNTDGNNDNDECVAAINALAREEGLLLEARCAGLEALGLEKIHTKGVIVDGERVLVSSINWNENSPCFNREAGVIVDHPGVGAYFTAVFEEDWTASAPATGKGVDWTKWAAAAGIVAVLAVLGYRRHRL